VDSQVNFHEVGLVKIVSGVVGALVSLRFVQGTWLEKSFMALGGSCLSYFATSPVAVWLDINNTEGLIGFIIGLFGMSIVAKGYELIQVIDARQAVSLFLDWLARKWRA
jgi:hypothetical protein